MTGETDTRWRVPRGGWVIGGIATAVALALVTGLIGYWIGTSRSPLTMHSCRAYSVLFKVSATSGRWREKCF